MVVCLFFCLSTCLLVCLFRLEIIENIYSLLFLKYEDLVTDGVESEDSRAQHFYTR